MNLILMCAAALQTDNRCMNLIAMHSMSGSPFSEIKGKVERLDSFRADPTHMMDIRHLKIQNHTITHLEKAFNYKGASSDNGSGH